MHYLEKYCLIQAITISVLVFLKITQLCLVVYEDKNITIQTDHAPLVVIMKKPIINIQINILRLLRLEFLLYNLKIQYLPGKYMFVAGFLSRCRVKTQEMFDQTMLEMVHTLCNRNRNCKLFR